MQFSVNATLFLGSKSIFLTVVRANRFIPSIRWRLREKGKMSYTQKKFEHVNTALLQSLAWSQAEILRLRSLL
jgi:hypothetical protein